MTDRSLNQGLPGDWDGARRAAREPHYGAAPFGASLEGINGAALAAAVAAARAAQLDTRPPAAPGPPVRHSAPPRAAQETGFLGALFDFGFTSFVTPKIIKVLYVLVMIGTVVGALALTIIVFKVSAAFGVVTLVFGDPLIILVVMAIYRIFLEFFVVIFRAAEDIRALREHGEAG
jgi:hypothetical protein